MHPHTPKPSWTGDRPGDDPPLPPERKQARRILGMRHGPAACQRGRRIASGRMSEGPLATAQTYVPQITAPHVSIMLTSQSIYDPPFAGFPSTVRSTDPSTGLAGSCRVMRFRRMDRLNGRPESKSRRPTLALSFCSCAKTAFLRLGAWYSKQMRAADEPAKVRRRWRLAKVMVMIGVVSTGRGEAQHPAQSGRPQLLF